MIKIKLLFLVLSVVVYEQISLHAENKNIAYIFNQKANGQVSKNIVSKLLTKMPESYPHEAFFYEVSPTKELVFSNHNNSKPEKTARYLVKFNFDIYENYNPELQIRRDQTGKIIEVYLLLEHRSKIQLKATDLETSQIVENVLEMIGGENFMFPHKFVITDYASRFTSIPEDFKKQKPKEYNREMQKLWDSLNEKFVLFYESKEDKVINALVSEQLKLLKSGLSEIINPHLDKEKVDYFIASPEYKNAKYQAEYTNVFTLDTLGDFVYANNLGLYVGKSEKDGEVKFTRVAFRGNSEEVGKAYLAGKKLYHSIGKQGYGEKLSNVVEFNLGIKSDSIEINNAMELYFKDLRGVKLYNFSDSELIDAFRNRYKGEAFMDQALNVRGQGLDYIMSISGPNSAFVTEVKSGKVTTSIDEKDSFASMYNKLMKAFGFNIEVIKITKEKKNKANELLLYSPLGFTNVNKMDVFVANAEDVGGKSIERLEFIGFIDSTPGASFDTKEKTDIADVKDGEAEIFEAIKSGKKLVVKLNEKSSLFDKLQSFEKKFGN